MNKKELINIKKLSPKSSRNINELIMKTNIYLRYLSPYFNSLIISWESEAISKIEIIDFQRIMNFNGLLKEEIMSSSIYDKVMKEYIANLFFEKIEISEITELLLTIVNSESSSEKKYDLIEFISYLNKNDWDKFKNEMSIYVDEIYELGIYFKNRNMSITEFNIETNKIINIELENKTLQRKIKDDVFSKRNFFRYVKMKKLRFINDHNLVEKVSGNYFSDEDFKSKTNLGEDYHIKPTRMFLFFLQYYYFELGQQKVNLNYENDVNTIDPIILDL